MKSKKIKINNTIKKEFKEIFLLIQQAKSNVNKRITAELIKLYWEIGQYISKKIDKARWGKSIVKNLSEYLKEQMPDVKGFSSQNLWRMKQFYDTYKDYSNIINLLPQLPWSSHLHILSKTKSIEEKEFYLRLVIKEKYSVRELERQLNSAFYERYMLSSPKLSPPARKIHPNISTIFRRRFSRIAFPIFRERFTKSYNRKLQTFCFRIW